METWKENNLLREYREHTYWRWQSKTPFGDRMVIALGVPNKKNEFKVLLRNSSHLTRQECATFNTKEDAEAFAAKAFPEEDGEAYITKSDVVDYVEVDTTFGKCLVSRRFYNLYEERLEWNKLSDSEKRDRAVKSFNQKIKRDCESIHNTYIAYLDGANNVFSYAENTISNTIRKKGVEEAERFVNDLVQCGAFSPDPVTALIYYMTYYQPEEMREVFSNKDKIFDKVIGMIKNGTIKVSPVLKREYSKLDINLL